MMFLISQTTSPTSLLPSQIREWSLHNGLTETTWSQWAILLGSLFAGVVVGKFLSVIAKKIAANGNRRGWEVYASIFSSAAGPVYLMAITLGLTIGIAPLPLTPTVSTFCTGVLKLLYIIAIGWYIFELIELCDLLLRSFAKNSSSMMEAQIIPLIRKTLRLFVVVVFVLFTAQNVFGADIGAWLAGLGIAGLAVSLAAQDSIKNLFGSLTIFLDKPFSVGERIVFDGNDGPVEEIGFRSTKIRTLVGELVTIPNSKIVDGSVRNIGRRPFLVRAFSIALTRTTTPEQLHKAIQIVNDIFALPEIAKPFKMETNPPRVFFDELTDTSFNLKISYWHFPPDWWAFCAHAEQFNMELVRRFNEAELAFAFPTQVLHLSRK
jgi:MscS family membrane protein